MRVPVTSTLQKGGKVIFAFDAAAGDSVTITIDAKFNTHLSVRDQHGAEIASDGDGSAQAALMNIELPDKGTYYILVTGATATEQGSFSITVTKR